MNNKNKLYRIAAVGGIAIGGLFAEYPGSVQADSSYFSLAGNLATGASEAIKPGETYRFKVQPVISEKNIVYGKTPETIEFKVASLKNNGLAIASPNIAYVNIGELVRASPAMAEYNDSRFKGNEARYGIAMHYGGEQARVALQNYARENGFRMITTSREQLEQMLLSAEVQSPEAWKALSPERRNPFLAGITNALNITPHITNELRKKVVEREKILKF